MNFLLHRQKSKCHVLPMPEGLNELMGDISREVLRCQPSPDCTYKFIADYLDSLLKARDKSKLAMEIIEEAILKTDEVYDQFVKCRIPKHKTASFIDAMEITFRRFVEQKRGREGDKKYQHFEAADLFKELINKCDLTKVEILRSRPAVQWAYMKFLSTYLAAIEGTLDVEDLYLDTEKLLISEQELNELNRSAIMIQKNYRGYVARKTYSQLKLSRGTASMSESFIDFQKYSEAEIHAAATKIQSRYRGFQARKRYPSLRVTLDSRLSTESENRDTSLRITFDSQKSTESADKDFEKFLEYAESHKDQLEGAAIKIQSSFRGYKTRKQVPIIHIDHASETHIHAPETHLHAPETHVHAPKTPTKSTDGADGDVFLEYSESHEDVVDGATVKTKATFKGYRTKDQVPIIHEDHVHDPEMHIHHPEMHIHDPEMHIHHPEMHIHDPEMHIHAPETPTKSTDGADGDVFLEYSESHEDVVDGATVKTKATFKGYRTKDQVPIIHEDHVHDPEMHIHHPEMHIHDPEMHIHDPEMQIHAPEMPTKSTDGADGDVFLEFSESHEDVVDGATVKTKATFKGYRTKDQVPIIHEDHLHDPEMHIHDPEMHIHDPEMHIHDPEMHIHDQEMHIHDPEMHIHDPEMHIHAPEMPTKSTDGADGDVFLEFSESHEDVVDGATVKTKATFKGYRTKDQVPIMHEDDLHDPEMHIHALETDIHDPEMHIHVPEMHIHAPETPMGSVDEDFEAFLEYTESHKDEMEGAALKIQASFKGYKARKEYKAQLASHSFLEPVQSIESSLDLNDPELEKAAVKIQSTYKGYQTRKHLHHPPE